MSAMEVVARRRLRDRRGVLLGLAHNTDSEYEERLPGGSERDSESVSEEVLARLTVSERAELIEVENALSRIEQGNFGQCESCGHAIGRQRLLSAPEARCCIICASGVEASARARFAS